MLILLGKAQYGYSPRLASKGYSVFLRYSVFTTIQLHRHLLNKCSKFGYVIKGLTGRGAARCKRAAYLSRHY